MRFATSLLTLAVLFAPSILAQDDQTTTTTVEMTTTITRTVVSATATSTITRSSSSVTPSSSRIRSTRTTAAESTPTSGEAIGAASMEHGNLVVVALVGVAAIALGL